MLDSALPDDVETNVDEVERHAVAPGGQDVKKLVLVIVVVIVVVPKPSSGLVVDAVVLMVVLVEEEASGPLVVDVGIGSAVGG